METRYDLSFMKEYAELYNLTDKALAEKFNCGIGVVPKILSGEIRVKEHAMEEIIYEFGYSDYNKFKEEIIQKITTKKNIIFDQKMEEIKQKEKDRKKQFEVMTIYDTFDFNKMNNKDRIIISLLCDEDLIYGIKQVSQIVNIDEEHVKTLYKKIIYNTEYIEHVKEKVKTKE